MKKFTLLSLAILLSVVVFAQKAPRIPAVQNMLKESLNKSEVQSSEFGAFQFGTPLEGVQVPAPRPLEANTSMRAPGRAAEDYVVITEQPEGELKYYTRGGGYYYVSNSSIYYSTQPGSIKVVWGTDGKVYFKDIISGLPEGTWVEGTLSEDGTTITVPLGQNIYYSSSYDACIAIQLINYDSEAGFVVDTEATEVVFNVEDGVLSLQGTGFTSVSLGAVWTDDGYIQNYGDYESVYTPFEPEFGQYTFDDNTLQGWTTIDADGDGYTWLLSSEVSGLYAHYGIDYCMLSQSYSSSVGALTPDNYLVSPKVVLGGKITFWACGQDENYAAEHFGVAVSTKGNTDAADFEMVSPEYVMTAAPATTASRSSRRGQGTWYQYEVDLSAYAGQEGYVAIRHYNCTDEFCLDVDDITIVEGEELSYADIVVNPEDITDGNITKALDAKKAEVLEAQKSIRHITINLTAGESYTLSGTLTAPNNILLQGGAEDGDDLATITMAEGMTDNIITLDGTEALAQKPDGTDSDHKLIADVTIDGVAIYGMQAALVKDAQKTLVENLTISNSIVEAPAAGKNVLDFNSKGYAGKVTVVNSSIYANGKNTGFFAQYGSRPKNVNGDWLQEFDVQNSTFANIANGKNICDLKQNGTAQNVYTLKNNIFVDCGKNGQTVVGFNKGQSSATPQWDVDGNVFNWGGLDTSAAETTKAGQKDGEDIVKNTVAGRITFTSIETPDLGGTILLAPEVEAVPETLGDPRWTIEWKQGYAINIDAKFGDVTTNTVGYAAEGDEVTITAKPNPADKFEFAGIKVEGVNSDLEVEVTPDEENPEKFTFTMPADAVVIIATFQRIAEDIIVNSEDIEGGDIAAALQKKIDEKLYVDEEGNEAPCRVKDIFIYLASGEAYTLSGTLTAPNNILLQGGAEDGDDLATITMAEGMTDNIITLDGTEALAQKPDGTDSDHKLIADVTIDGVAIYGMQAALVKDAQKTLVENLTISNSIVEAPAAGKNVLDFNSKGYAGKVTVVNSSIYANGKNTGFFAQYGSRPKNVNGDWLQEFDVQNSTFANIANGKNICDLKQNGTAQNVYTLKNNIFVDCGKNGQTVVGFNKGQSSATPQWDVDGNVFNWGGLDTSAAETTKAGQKDGEDIVKNSLAGRVEFADIAEPDLGGRMILAPGVEAPESMPGDPRWTLTTAEGFNITVIVSKDGTGSASAEYTYAAEGDEVGLTTTPAEGYEIEAIVMTDANGKLLDTVDGDSFVMPGEDVIIVVTYTKTTGIDDVTTAESEEGAWFTIKGIRIDKPVQKGLYIHNGKKVVIK